jgi:hypothetical protein
LHPLFIQGDSTIIGKEFQVENYVHGRKPLISGKLEDLRHCISNCTSQSQSIQQFRCQIPYYKERWLMQSLEISIAKTSRRLIIRILNSYRMQIR